MRVRVPSLASAMIDPRTGTLTAPWVQFFQNFVSQPPAPTPTTPLASPYEYTASERGSVSVSGGTVSLIEYTRGNTTFTTGFTSGIIPVAQGDSVRITYTVAPVIWFIPG